MTTTTDMTDMTEATKTTRGNTDRIPRVRPKPEMQPWRTSAERSRRPAVARGSGKPRPLAVSVTTDFDVPQSEWFRQEAERTGASYDDIIKALVDRERAKATEP